MGRSEVPSYSELLSSERFILRSNIIKTQAEAYLKHPLFLAINAARTEPRAQRNKITFQHWDHLKDLEPTADIFDALENGGSYLTPDLIYAHGGSSMGNVSNSNRENETISSKPKITDRLNITTRVSYWPISLFTSCLRHLPCSQSALGC